MSETRQQQLSYSELQHLMHDRDGRRRKAAKMVAIITHFLGREDLGGLRVLDAGSSSGIIASELTKHGAWVVGVDIDVPGLGRADTEFGDTVCFVNADSEKIPFGANTFDVIICNHVYEHVVDDVQLFAELRRVVRTDGLLYLGLGNKLGIIEPHYKLPFLSWLPAGLADRYMRLTGKGDRYHERFRTWAGLEELSRGLTIWDYTWTVLAEPQRFAPGERVPAFLGRLSARSMRLLRPALPTYLWVATVTPQSPQGSKTSCPPTKVR